MYVLSTEEPGLDGGRRKEGNEENAGKNNTSKE
jgi:hypothetical protein